MSVSAKTLFVSLDWLGLIRLLEILDLVLCQRLALDLDRLIQSRQAAEPNNRGRPLLNNPRQRHLAHLPALFVGNLLDATHNLLVCCSKLPLRLVLPPVRLALLGQWACQNAAVERTPGDPADPGLVAELVHLTFFLAVQQGVVVLHADELGPPAFLGDGLQLSKLVCVG